LRNRFYGFQMLNDECPQYGMSRVSGSRHPSELIVRCTVVDLVQHGTNARTGRGEIYTGNTGHAYPKPIPCPILPSVFNRLRPLFVFRQKTAKTQLRGSRFGNNLQTTVFRIARLHRVFVNGVKPRCPVKIQTAKLSPEQKPTTQTYRQS